MTRTLSFEVRGTPAPQGSKKGFSRLGSTRVQMVESSAKVKPWREDVRAAALTAMGDGWEPIDGPVEVWVTFYLPAPKSLPKKVYYPTKRPDLDKLARSTLDALTSAGVYLDDSKVTDLHVLKRYVGRTTVMGVSSPGAAIDIEELRENGWGIR